ncbi:hypothetical protein NQ315_006359 [Exocentrus adspersus]|uniref:FAD synthase n=1 Tax=Exocentrus adspersus TaxID=1586481 RepID=A0AAV8W0F1_9CUCU|nr:hypothetical protein NQ315_006359 [Exocentrus adspersus]
MFKTVAVILVNDLFLCGAEDCNTLKRVLLVLNHLNYLVKKVSVLHKNERIITNELDTLAKQFDVVIIVEKLADDAVFKALANVTYQNLTTNLKPKERVQECNNYQLPVCAKALTSNDSLYPVVQVQGIFVLSEKYLETQLRLLSKRLEQYRTQAKYSKVLRLQLNGNLTQVLNRIKELQVKHVCQKKDAEVCVTLESPSFENLVESERAIRDLKINIVDSHIGSNSLQSIHMDPDERIRQAIETIETCLQENGPENVFLSFNGGKDCTVLLHLIYTVLKIKYPSYKNPIVCLYVQSENAFPEQDQFISQCQTYFNLEVITVVQSIKQALGKILAMKPNLKACFMGTRRTDPYSSDLKVFQMTDRDWPQVMRVSPLLDWHYSDIWDYLLYYKVPYCKLYDMGFTSLGNASNTIRNPSLLYKDIYLGAEVYLPAYKMLNENKERSGRHI